MAGKKKDFITILRESGFIYRGSSACFARDILFSGIYFPTYYIIRDKLLEKYNLGISSTIAGVLSGIPSAYLATPFDVIKTRLQTNRNDGIVYNGLVDCIQKIWKNEGFKTFWKGGIQRIIRSSPQFGITLFVYEYLSK
jgi:solute carrier family 25 aspartate/glutamate transporter 12/13